MVEEDDKRLNVIIIGGVAGAALFVCVMGAAAWYVAGSGQGAANLVGAIDGTYEPTSQWIEEGLDPNVTQFGFEGGEAPEGGELAIESSGGGELSEVALHNMMLQKQNEMMPCYVEALNQDPDASGTVDMQFGIAPDGHVAMVKVVGSTLEDKPMEDCLVETSRYWSFPATGRATLMKFDTDFTFVTE
jgi:hypothetical protein